MLGLLWFLGALVVVGTALMSHRLTAASRWWPVVILQIGVVMTVVNPLRFTYSEPLAGLLIALSVLVALREWRDTSVLLGTAALFVRELAAPYVGIRLLLAVWKRDWRDAAGWSLGLVCYCGVLPVALEPGDRRNAVAPRCPCPPLLAAWAGCNSSWRLSTQMSRWLYCRGG